MFHVEQNTPPILLAQPKDHLVSGERFELFLDVLGEVAKTHPAPEEKDMGHYYSSDAYISHGNRKSSLFESVYALAQNQMFAQKKRWIQATGHRKGRYLDFGCGSGGMISYLQTKGWTAEGVEPSTRARAHAGHPKNIHPHLDHVLEKSFDVIALWHVLEHLHAPEKIVIALREKLDAEGHLFIAVPNFKSWDAAFFHNEWAAYDVPRHLWHFSNKGLIRLIESLGFVHQKTFPMPLDAFYVSYLSLKHQQKRFPLFRGFFYGLWSNLVAFRSGEYSSNVFVFRKN